MNILQISEYLKGVPKDFLIKEATMPSGNYPQYLVVSELSRRTSMEKQFAGIASQQTPQETVAERTIKEATAVENVGRSAPGEMPMTGIASQGTRSGVPTGMQMKGNYEEPSGQETMGVPAAVRMFEGGRVSFDRGGFGEDRLKEEEDYKLPFYKRLGKFMPFSRLFSEKDEYGLAPDDYTDTEVLEARIAELGDPDPGSPSFLMKQNLLSQLSEQREKLDSQPRGGIAVDFPYFGQADSLTRNIKAMDEQIANMEDGPEKQALINQRNTAEERRVSLYEEGKAPSITEEVAKDQANRADETAPPETKKPKDEPKEKAPKFNFEEFATSTLTTDYKQIEKDILDRFPKLGEDKTLGGYMQEIKDLREVDYTEKMKGLIDGIEDEARQAELQAVPNALIALGIGIASGDPGQGLLGGFVNGAAKALGVFQDQKKEAREIRRMKREAMGNLYSMMDAQQRGDMQEARRLKEAYQTRKDNLAVAEADLGFKIATLAADDNKTRLVATLNNKAQEVQNAFTAAIKKYEIDTNKGIAATKAAQDAVSTYQAMSLKVLQLENEPELFVDVPEDQRNIILNRYKEYLQGMNKSLFVQLGLPVPEGMKKGGITKLNRNPKSLFDFHREE